MPRIETVVVQPTPFCNIDCRYCYLPSRSDRSTMSQATVAAIFDRVFASGWSSPHLTVIWHAGEPLVMPIAFYEEAFAAIETRRPASVTVRHAIQTNGMLLTPAWCELVKRHDVNLGVSIDGPRELHDANRVTRSGKGTFDRTIAGVRLLRRERVPFHVISVLTARSLGMARELLDFYTAEGIEDVCFNVEESEGSHASTLMCDGGAREAFRAFLEEFWILSRQGTSIRFVREIDGMIPRILRPGEACLGNEQVEPFGMVNVDCRGNVSTYSPELLGLKDARYADFVVGNVHEDALETMLASEAMRAMARDVAAGTAMCERECGYWSVCGGGSPINKLTENGTFASTATTFCRLVQQVPVDLVLSALDRLERSIESRTPPSAAGYLRSLPSSREAAPPRGRRIDIPVRSA